MTEVLLTKSMGGLRPHSDDAYRVLTKIPNGAGVLADIKDTTRRSGRQHRFWFALANILFESQEHFEDFEKFRACLLIKLGFCEVFKFQDGTHVPVAHSLKFSKMSPDEFGRLVDATLDFAVAMGFDRDTLLAETEERVGQAA